MEKKEKKYGLIQIPADAYELLKKHCELHGFKLGAFVGNLIKKEVKRKSNEKDIV